MFPVALFPVPLLPKRMMFKSSVAEEIGKDSGKCRTHLSKLFTALVSPLSSPGIPQRLYPHMRLVCPVHVVYELNRGTWTMLCPLFIYEDSIPAASGSTLLPSLGPHLNPWYLKETVTLSLPLTFAGSSPHISFLPSVPTVSKSP